MTTITDNPTETQYVQNPLEVARNFGVQDLLTEEKPKALGNTANITAKTDITSEKHHATVNKYKLQSVARRLLNDANLTSPRTKKPHRTRHCCFHLAEGNNAATIKLSRNDIESHASISGVQTCSSVWACPVCAPRIAVEKGNDIRDAIAWSKSAGLLPIMVTLTARHDISMRLALFKDSFSSSWKWFSNHRSWKEFKADYGVHHWIAAREVTHGGNGWHYHMHIMLFLDAKIVAQLDDMSGIDEELTGHWLKSLNQHGLEGLPEYALKTTANENIGEKYLAKLGLAEDSATTDLSYELSGTQNKKSRTQWDLLRHASYGDEHASELYIEFVTAMSGDNWITWSRGLHAAVNEYIESIEEEEGDEEQCEEMKNWATISDYWWYVVMRSNALHTVIDIAARTRSISDVRDYLYRLRSELIDSDRLTDYYRLYKPVPDSIADIRLHEDWKK